MSSVNSLLITCITKFYPDQMLQIIGIANENGYDFSFIEQEIAKHNTTLEAMNDFNREYEPWWGLPHIIAAYTTNKSILSDQK